MSKYHHQRLLHDNITKTYQKTEAPINLEAKTISTKLKISDRTKRIARTPAFVTLKGHKVNFLSNPTFRLINPLKNKLWKVSKQLLERINSDIVKKLKLNQWCNTVAVWKCFNNIAEKSICRFIQFGIKEFYSLITENILHQTLKLAKQHTNIDKNDLRIIYRSHKSLLSSDNKTWKKKSTDSCFDVTMGSCNGAEIFELVALYVQSKLEMELIVLTTSNDYYLQWFFTFIVFQATHQTS